ncbi:period circadian protein homolog 1b isoform X1 [Alosa sapidissima]|uniref:period circadian protein homolog 1b isoform X1 n=1 Tax=Alosa sapidissima TaxID=34773 RepID=UPI001C08B719|nr:period circadian protein homolog 1b isoform X1 [Alosa sapidissima]XP_041925421.1 period circadian protein homolog 1b isoform X1 [Alosa sapidissima]
MSYENHDTAPSNGTRGGGGQADEEEDAGHGSPDMSGGSTSPEGVNRDSGSSPSGASGGAGGSSGGDPRGTNSDDTDALSSGNDSGERESEERENGSRGMQFPRSYQSSSSHNCKDSGMLETTESNKSLNSHSPSPPSSSVGYSLLSGGSSERDPPSTSGCSSDQSARVQTQKELMKALKELKIRLPAERKPKGRSSTLNALKYALSCVKQVRANQEYYHQWNIEECHGCSLDLSAFTIDELDNITSEYTLKNTDTCSIAVSFLSGKVVYISPQSSSLMRCKPERLQGALFSELLAPQDISTFYSSTAPCRLPPWAACIGSASPPVDCTQEKSMFCRISADVLHGGEMRYYPFRLTPYQLTLRDSDASEPQPCCLLIAERVHSGYEAPRIPPDKRIFTTSHTPSCLFQEVDERAVPLLGYLPQDLVGTPVLLYVHPEDRHIMVAIHKKILQFAGQPFDHSPLRMCARSGEYLTIDTSWSSFVNPWSRKVAFIVGRHKVRTSPLNEDVFTPPRAAEGRSMVPEIPQLSEQIHRLLAQPVHCGGSQGYSSLTSSGGGSHEQHQSAASSSESNGPVPEDVIAVAQLLKPMTFQQICKDVHMVKTSGQQVFIESRNRPPPRKHANTGASGSLRAIRASEPITSFNPQTALPPKSTAPSQLMMKEPPSAYSYQQINCLDSIIRYLEGCNLPSTVKRKCGSSSCTASSTSDDDKQQDTAGNSKGPAVALVGEAPPLPPLALPKPESVASVTSQCSFSSTIVHVGDKKPPESDIVMEDAPPTPTSAPPTVQVSVTPTTAATFSPPPVPVTPAPAPSPAPPAERESRRGGGASRRGLTKEVLSAHTQQEEQNFLYRFRDLSQLRVFDSATSLKRPTTTPLARGVRCSRDYPAAGSSSRRRGRGGKRLKHQESIDQGSRSLRGPTGPPVPNVAAPPTNTFPLGPPTTSSSWPTSVGSQASLPSVPYPPGMLPLYPLYPPLTDPSLQAGLRFPLQNVPMSPQMVPPMMALVLPNYMFPQMNAACSAAGMGTVPFFNPNSAFVPPPFAAASAGVNPGMASLPPSTLQQMPQTPTPTLTTATLTQGPRPASRSSTPLSVSQREAGGDREESMLLPSSRCSSPLNLLQLEEPPSNRLEGSAQQTMSTGGQGAGAGGQRGGAEDKENESGEANESNNDAMSTSSEFLDLLLQEDSRSGTGSAASGSGSSGSGSSGSGLGSSGSSGSGLGSGSGSGSNGCSSSGSRTRSSQSSNTSKYFGSIDSSENDHSRKQSAGGDGEAQFIKCVLQDPIWLLMANTDDKVMMTYQLPTRDRETVLREDRMALRAMQKHQPRFTEEQKRELSQVHPWIRTGRLPRAINITACQGCKSPTATPPAPPFDVEIHEMELCSVLTATEERASAEKLTQADTAMEEGEGDVEAERPAAEREQRRKGSEDEVVVVEEDAETDNALGKDQEMATEEKEMTSSQSEQGKVTVMTH